LSKEIIYFDIILLMKKKPKKRTRRSSHKSNNMVIVLAGLVLIMIANQLDFENALSIALTLAGLAAIVYTVIMEAAHRRDI